LDADYVKEIEYLKKKVDAGAGACKQEHCYLGTRWVALSLSSHFFCLAFFFVVPDFIITQMFFDVGVYKQFVKDCRAAGITCPIVPGLMCINAYAGFKKMTGFCKTRVPAELESALEKIKDDATAVKEFGIEFGTQQCLQLLEGDDAPPVLHFYTLNLEKVVYGILEKLGLLSCAASVNESDAATQVATGSAWARVGDKVTSIYGTGTVLEMDNATAAATVQIDSWIMAAGQKPIAFLQKGQYKKVF